MNSIILGTAGHIDHGKSTLIKALTGITPDRLKEEKKRGITIDLGFAFIDLPSGKRIGVVDVPGHEKFIKNMMTGATGIDVVLLVVAADEGVMPQTIEHLNILKLLNIEKGLIAITKKDLVDNEWLELVIDDTREYVKGTFLEKAPIVPVSATTGDGIDKLISEIDKLCTGKINKDTKSPFRLPIDRVFTLQGIGTIITGSLLSGTIRVGENVEIFPRKITSRIRSIQIHGESYDRAEAGNRTALNLTDVKTDEIKRGDVVSKVGALMSTTKAYVFFQLLKDSPHVLKNRERVRFHIGTKEVMARIELLDRNILNQGEKTFVLVHFEEPVVTVYKDHFIVRSYSPITTIGGGQILYINPKRIKKRELDKAIDILGESYKGSAKDFILGFLSFFGQNCVELYDICPHLGMNIEQVREVCKVLLELNRIIAIKVSDKDYIFDKTYYEHLTEKLLQQVKKYHKDFPISEGIAKEELRSRINLDSKLFESMLKGLEEQDLIEIQQNIVKLKGFEVKLDKKQQQIYNDILENFNKHGWAPPSISDLASDINTSEEETVEIIYRLVNDGNLAKLNEEIFMSVRWVEKSILLLQQFFKENDELTVSKFRKMLGTTRKYALPLLEYLDRLKITRRVKSIRVAGSKI